MKKKKDLEIRVREKELSRKQKAAISLAKKLGRKLAEEYPEIVDEYREGATLKEIGNKYIGSSVGLAAAYNALLILLDEKEFREIALAHKRTSGRKAGRIIGRKNYEQGRGIFSLTREKREKARRKGGRRLYKKRKGIFALTEERLSEARRNGGRLSYEQGKGIFALTREELSEAARRSVVVRGQKPYSDVFRKTDFGYMDERSYIITLRCSGYLWREITEKINRIFENNRNIKSLQNNYKRWKGKIFEPWPRSS